MTEYSRRSALKGLGITITSAISVSSLSSRVSAQEYTQIEVKSKSSNGVDYELQYNEGTVQEVSATESNDSTSYSSCSGTVSGYGSDYYRIERSAELQKFEATAKNGGDASILLDQDKNLGFSQDGTTTVSEGQNDNRVDYELHGSENTTFTGYGSYNEWEDGIKDSNRSDADRMAYGWVKSGPDKWDVEGQFSAILLELSSGANGNVTRDI